MKLALIFLIFMILRAFREAKKLYDDGATVLAVIIVLLPLIVIGAIAAILII